MLLIENIVIFLLLDIFLFGDFLSGVVWKFRGLVLIIAWLFVVSLGAWILLPFFYLNLFKVGLVLIIIVNHQRGMIAFTHLEPLFYALSALLFLRSLWNQIFGLRVLYLLSYSHQLGLFVEYFGLKILELILVLAQQLIALIYFGGMRNGCLRLLYWFGQNGLIYLLIELHFKLGLLIKKFLIKCLFVGGLFVKRLLTIIWK